MLKAGDAFPGLSVDVAGGETDLAIDSTGSAAPVLSCGRTRLRDGIDLLLISTTATVGRSETAVGGGGADGRL
jgi:hypothetical protein